MRVGLGATDAASRPIRSMLVLGGGSEIAVAFAEKCIDEGLDRLVLAGRAGGSTDSAAAAMLERHPDVKIDVAGFDGAATDTHAEALRSMAETSGPFDTVLVAFGALGEPFSLATDPHEAAQLINVNFSGAVSSTLAALNILRGEPDARLIVVSSIVAVRPRIGNLAYGAAKAGLDAFLSELREPARDVGVDLTVVRPGFVHTKMTEGLTAAPFATTPDVVADDMFAGINSGTAVVHSPKVLGPVGLALRALPQPIWRKVSER